MDTVTALMCYYFALYVYGNIFASPTDRVEHLKRCQHSERLTANWGHGRLIQSAERIMSDVIAEYGLGHSRLFLAKPVTAP